ncbi:hypothetical protein ACWEP8_36295 [Streptomyces hydrogenans]
MQHPSRPHDPAAAHHADAVAEAACELADVTAEGGWSPGAVDDTVEALETLAAAGLATAPLSPPAQRALARLTDASAALRTAIGSTHTEENTSQATSAVPQTRPRRRGLGHGWQAIR